jgi:hypothetical protein
VLDAARMLSWALRERRPLPAEVERDLVTLSASS